MFSSAAPVGRWWTRFDGGTVSSHSRAPSFGLVLTVWTSHSGARTGSKGLRGTLPLLVAAELPLGLAKGADVALVSTCIGVKAA